jgi:hypothetical protein
MTLRERIEALIKVWEQREKEPGCIGLPHPGLSELRALLAEAESPWNRICPVCGHGFAVDVSSPSALVEPMMAEAQKNAFFDGATWMDVEQTWVGHAVAEASRRYDSKVKGEK